MNPGELVQPELVDLGRRQVGGRVMPQYGFWSAARSNTLETWLVATCRVSAGSTMPFWRWRTMWSDSC